jgi:hydrogenase expression/formation protein HypD
VGNIKAKKICDEVFEPRDDEWRGLGIIPGSGLKINSDFSRFDAEKHFNIEIKQTPEPAGCICGEILRGLKTPRECTLFGLTCTPSNPVGACMVSAEGTCATYYKYRS